MKAPAFDYVRPKSLGEAISLLTSGGGEARVMAGGQSLLALMNLRVAAPALVIDIARMLELTGAAEADGMVTLGAGVTHAMIEDGRVPDPSQGLMPYAAAGLAYRAVRNRGTLGGSLALADPAAEWPAVLTALGTAVVVRGRDGTRSLDCAQFATGIFETRLAPDEIVERLDIPKLSVGARWGYVKLARKTGAFAEALAVAVRDPAHGLARVVLGSANGPPLILAETAEALAAGERDREKRRHAIIADLDRAAERRLDAYQRTLLTTAALRALQQATA